MSVLKKIWAFLKAWGEAIVEARQAQARYLVNRRLQGWRNHGE